MGSRPKTPPETRFRVRSRRLESPITTRRFGSLQRRAMALLTLRMVTCAASSPPLQNSRVGCLRTRASYHTEEVKLAGQFCRRELTLPSGFLDSYNRESRY